MYCNGLLEALSLLEERAILFWTTPSRAQDLLLAGVAGPYMVLGIESRLAEGQVGTFPFVLLPQLQQAVS